MPQPTPKSWTVIFIDFVIGAVGGDIFAGIAYLRGWRSGPGLSETTLLIAFLACSLICGSLAALFRNEFWSGINQYSILPPPQETLTTRSKVVLWILVEIGAVVPGLLYFV